MATNNELTLMQALEIIRGDGVVAELQGLTGLWNIYYDTAPSTRHMSHDLTEADVIKYAETILMVRRCHQGRM